MNGVNFQFTPFGATFVATNTYILVKYTINYLKFNHYINFTISKKSLKIIKNILINNNYIKKIIIEYNQIDLVKFKFKNKIFLCKIINKKYPNYNYVIPNYNYTNNENISLKINRILFLNSIKRISLFTKKKFIFFSFKNNKIKIYANNTSIYNYLNIEFINNNFKYESIKIGFNYKYLINILSSLHENFINFEFYHLNKIGLFKQNNKKENILILIMSIII
ncbi:DNA polymerase III subunit beta [Blattabacterium cuenoti]|uniref:DNA polymerase III subunit beta n=1 Tax=Blattabacterium cuenoti TaxID=1653831 RepID=UPI001EEAC9C0|nr:DNA polymerase III subunit beta [Blattabacterium cuenoti]